MRTLGGGATTPSGATGASPVEVVPKSLSSLLSRLECVGDRAYSARELPGGLTNRNYRVQTDEADLVVRVAAPHGRLLSIDRDSEHYNSVAAAEAGVGAPVVEYRPDLGVLVVGYIAARTLTAEDLRDGRQLSRVAEACRRLHSGRRFRGDFDMFEIQARYLSIVKEQRFRLPERYLEYMPAVERVRAALVAHPPATVPCNNDLLAGNILDDGEEIHLIDYEYSGNNDPCFELGNIWSESSLSLDQLEELVGHYFGRPHPELVARARLQGLMSKYGWTLWASIQHATAENVSNFDFWGWGLEKYERAVAEFEDPAFGRLLDQAAGS